MKAIDPDYPRGEERRGVARSSGVRSVKKPFKCEITSMLIRTDVKPNVLMEPSPLAI